MYDAILGERALMPIHKFTVLLANIGGSVGW